MSVRKLGSYRKKIDAIDSKLVRLIGKRLHIVKAIGLYKKKQGLKIRDPIRESEVLASVVKLAKKEKINPKTVKDIYKSLFQEAYKIEKKK